MWLCFGERFEVVDVNSTGVEMVLLRLLSADDDWDVVNGVGWRCSGCGGGGL